jgi:hypothetical protein
MEQATPHVFAFINVNGLGFIVGTFVGRDSTTYRFTGESNTPMIHPPTAVHMQLP